MFLRRNSLLQSQRLLGSSLFSTVAKKEGPKLTIARHPYSLTDKPIDTTGANFFAVIGFQGKQYKVTKDDVFISHTLQGVDIGQTIDISDVLLVGSQKGTVIGRPTVSGAVVKAQVEELSKDKKVVALKFRRRKNSRRLKGFRREIAALRITDIIPPSEIAPEL